MKGFIEVTEIGGDRILLGIGKIISVLECDNGTFIETDVDKRGESTGVLVREHYEEIKNKIQKCEV